MKRRAPFLVLEGLDGAGTTTQTERVRALWAERAGADPLTTREPTDGPIGRLIRARIAAPPDPDAPEPSREALALLFGADRLDHGALTIRPALEAGRPVISDRYTPSSLVYQADAGPGGEADFSWVARLNERALAPDLIVVLRVGLATSLERLARRGGARDLFETPERLRIIAARYDQVVAALSARGQEVAVIDGERPIEAVTEAIWETLAPVRARYAHLTTP